MLSRIILTVLTAMTCFAVGTRADVMRNINISDGLYSNQMMASTELDDHRILMCINGGFTIYDGACFYDCDVNFNKSYAISSYLYSNIYKGNNGEVWIKYYNKLYLFDQKTTSFNEHLGAYFKRLGIRSHVCNFFMDEDRHYWLATNDRRYRIYCCDGSGKARQILSTNGHVQVCNVTTMADRQLLFMDDGNMRCYEAETGRLVYEDRSFQGTADRVLRFFCRKMSDRQLLLGFFRNGISKFYTFDIVSRKKTFLFENKDFIVKMLPDRNGSTYIVFFNTMIKLDRQLRVTSETHQLVTRDKTFSNANLCDAFCDWQGGLWLSSASFGLFYDHPQEDIIEKFNVCGTSDRTFDNPIRFLGKGKPSEILFCSNSGAYAYDAKNHKRTTLLQEKDIAEYYSIRTDADGYWTATSNGLYVVKDGHRQLFGMKTIPNLKSSRCTFTLNVEGRVLACFGSTQIGWLDIKTGRFMPLAVPARYSSRYREFWNAHYDRHNHLIVMESTCGLVAYDMRKGRFSPQTERINDFDGHSVACEDYLCDSHGNRWFATKGGLFLINKKGKKMRLTARNGLPSTYVNALCEDHRGQIWVATVNGLASINCKGDAYDSVEEIDIRSYDVSNILDGFEIPCRCLIVSGNEIWMSSTSNLIRVVPNSMLHPFRCSYTPVLSAFAIYDNPVPQSGMLGGKQIYDRTNQTIHLTYNQNYFALHFSACDYLKPTHTSYRYMLDDYDKTWRLINSSRGDAVVTYTNVSPGDYAFHIQTRGEDGTWGPVTTWTIHIDTPWWLSYWAYAVYLALFVALVLGIRKIYRVRNQLIDQLKSKHNKFLVLASEVKPNDIDITSRDKLFLQKAVALVDKNMSNPDYGVVQLSSDLAYSRSQLYRKLQSVSGQSPTDFIHTVRLRRAARLLLKSGLTVEEIANQTGYNSSKYFCRCFKRLYGSSPSDYAKSQPQQDKP